MTGPYDDIIHLPHHTSTKHARMAAIDRAAQFSPFAALTGYGAAIQETGRVTCRKVELAEDEALALDRKQAILNDHLSEHPALTVTYFVPDLRKEGGAYQTVRGHLKGMDGYARCLILTDGTRIPLADILDLDSPVLKT